MEYSHKTVLVPQEVYNAIKYEKTRNQNDCIVKGEDKLHAILEDLKLPTDHKMKLFNQELQKELDSKPKEKSNKKDKSECDYHHDNMIEKELIQSLPMSLKVKGKLLLERLIAYNVNWNSAGELIISMTKYDSTNIIDLVNYVM